MREEVEKIILHPVQKFAAANRQWIRRRVCGDTLRLSSKIWRYKLMLAMRMSGIATKTMKIPSEIPVGRLDIAPSTKCPDGPSLSLGRSLAKNLLV
jgi:hypothetical protein